MSEPLTAEELRRLRSDTEAGYTASAPTVAALLATIDALAAATERLRAVSLERTLEWLEEKWEFPCPACGGGCYRSRAAEKKYCYACGHKFEPEIQSALAGPEGKSE